ncbi:putative conserved secreted protein [Synechococcus sp. BOUM118]|nr:putative conserved secreted protein [Synechococcus sp. BOUM118]QNJ15501.1 putative conserved secreted protein [Synechococcus sp. A18-46.1]
MRFALSLGMLLGMSHGWVTAEGQANNNSGLLEVVRTVKSTTSFSPFSSGQHQFFPY